MPASERRAATHRKRADKASLEAEVEAERNPLRRFLWILGPGFISGAADDDPSGIGTDATAGASLGFATLWTALLTFPLMAAVQLVCAKIGLVTGRGLAAGVLLLSSRAVDRDCRARHRTIGDQDRPGASLWGRLGSLAGGRPLVIDDYT